MTGTQAFGEQPIPLVPGMKMKSQTTGVTSCQRSACVQRDNSGLSTDAPWALPTGVTLGPATSPQQHRPRADQVKGLREDQKRTDEGELTAAALGPALHCGLLSALGGSRPLSSQRTDSKGSPSSVSRADSPARQRDFHLLEQDFPLHQQKLQAPEEVGSGLPGQPLESPASSGM